MQNWIIKKGFDRRIRTGHPWVFSNELNSSPKGIEPGSPIRLLDSKGDFLAWGYGNPKSLISFRAVSFKPTEDQALSESWMVEHILNAWTLRYRLGCRQSFRMVYSEADSLPGLILDYYTCQNEDKITQVFSGQILTSGMERATKNLLTILESVVSKSIQAGISNISWSQTTVILKNDVSIRELEGMRAEPTKILKSTDNFDPENASVLIPAASSDGTVVLTTNFVSGQKTGLFLDQSQNIELVVSLTKKMLPHISDTVRILDLCCYVGNWSVQLTHFLKSQNKNVEVTLVDASENSLKFAQRNLEKLGATVKPIHGDVLEDLGDLKSNSFDIVISDPPAFIKSRREIPQGKHGYMKLNTESYRLTTMKGICVSCSCSGLLSEDEFFEALAKSARRAGKQMLAIARGGHAPDHPVLQSFPEGRYLKMLVTTPR